MKTPSQLALLCMAICSLSFANPSINPLATHNNALNHSANSLIQKQWQFKMNAIPHVTYVDPNNVIYALSQNNSHTTLYVINSQGQEKWHLDLPNQHYATPCTDIMGNVYIFGEDMSLTSITPNGVIRWRINIPHEKNEVGNTEVALSAGKFTSLIYATSTQGKIFIYHWDGSLARIYSPLHAGKLVSAPIEWYDGRQYTITFAMNLAKNKWDDDASEIHTLLSESNGDMEDRLVARLQGNILRFDQGLYSKIIYIVLVDHTKKSLMALYQSGTILWSRSLSNDNAIFTEREDDPIYFKQVYYADLEENKNVILAVDVFGNVIFKTDFNIDKPTGIFAYKNNLIIISDSGHDCQTITVLDRKSGKLRCTSDPITPSSMHAMSEAGQVYLISSDNISDFETCAKA